MKAVIIGAGEVGYELAESICRKGHDVIIVDSDEKACERARTLDIKVVKGNGARPELLNSLDLKKRDHFFAVTDDNETNLVTCAMAKGAGCKTMARINGLEYISKSVSRRFSNIGVDYAVSPELLIAKKIANIVSTPAAIDMNLSMGERINVVEYKVMSNTKVLGKKISRIDIPPNVNLGAIVRGNDVMVPRGDTVLKEGDKLIVMMDGMDNAKKMIQLLGSKKQKKHQTVMIVGATSIGINVAGILHKRGITVKIIDGSKSRCRKAAETLEKIEIIHGDARNKRLLIEEGILRTDAFTAATLSEEFNVLVSLLAKIYGVEKTIAVVKELGLKSLIETVGIDMAASPQLQTAQMMLRLARELNPLKAISIHGGDLYILEVNVTKDSKILGQSLNDCNLPEECIVGAIIRGDKTLIPRGKVVLKDGDEVILFVLKEQISRVEDQF